jgi:hypothetical protein
VLDQGGGQEDHAEEQAGGEDLGFDAGRGDHLLSGMGGMHVGPRFRCQRALALFGGHRITSMLMTFSPLDQVTR